MTNINEQFYSCVKGSTNLVQATKIGTDYIREKIGVTSIIHKMLPYEKVTLDQTYTDVDEKLHAMFDLSPSSPGAKESLGDSTYVFGKRYSVGITTLVTMKYRLQQASATEPDACMKYILDPVVTAATHELDHQFISMVDAICTNAPGPGLPHNFTGKVQWREFDNLSPENLLTAHLMMMKGSSQGTTDGVASKYRLISGCALLNDTTYKASLEQNGESVQVDITKQTFMGIPRIQAKNKDLVPDGVVYFFTKPELLGRHIYMDDWALWLRTEFDTIESYGYRVGGFAISNVAGVTKAVFKL